MLRCFFIPCICNQSGDEFTKTPHCSRLLVRGHVEKFVKKRGTAARDEVEVHIPELSARLLQPHHRIIPVSAMKRRKKSNKKLKVKTSNKAWSAESFVAFSQKKEARHKNRAPSGQEQKAGRLFFEQMRLVDDWHNGLRPLGPVEQVDDKRRRRKPKQEEEAPRIEKLPMPIEFKPGKVELGSKESFGVLPVDEPPQERANIDRPTPKMLAELKKKKKKRVAAPTKTLEDLEESKDKKEREIARALRNRNKLENMIAPEKSRRAKQREDEDELRQVRNRVPHGATNKAPPEFSAAKEKFMKRAKVLKDDFHKHRKRR